MTLVEREFSVECAMPGGVATATIRHERPLNDLLLQLRTFAVNGIDARPLPKLIGAFIGSTNVFPFAPIGERFIPGEVFEKPTSFSSLREELREPLFLPAEFDLTLMFQCLAAGTIYGSIFGKAVR